MSIYSIVEDEIKAYNDTVVDSNPTFASKQKDVLDLIDMYWSSKFREGDKDALGYKKVFYNIVNFPVETNSKMIDLDTKDIQIMAEDGQSYWPAWLMGKELAMWMKDKYFGRQLNEYALQWPKYGHLFAKKVDDDVVLVPPKNMKVRPDATSIKYIPIIEEHKYTPAELQQVGAERGWKRVDDAVKNLDEDGKVVIYEVYFPPTYLTEAEWDVENPTHNYFIMPEDQSFSLFSAKKPKCPYKDLSWEKLPDRLMGRGVVEKLFEEQIFLNRIKNYESEGLHWTSKHIYQTRDTGVASNLMTDVKNGEIMIMNSELTPVSVEERNLSMYMNATNLWEENAVKRAFAREPITGGAGKTGITLGSTILSTRMAMGYFEQKKEELGMFIKEILWDWIIPEFKKQNRSEHKVLIETLMKGDDDNSEKFFRLKLNEKMNDLKWTTKKPLTPEQWKIRKGIQAEILKGQELNVPESLYDNLKYKIKINIVGESVDTAQKITTLQTVFQILGSNPTVLQDKRIRKVFYKMLDLAGINPEDLQLNDDPIGLQEVAEEARAQVGGSIASPQMPQAGATAQSQTSL